MSKRRAKFLEKPNLSPDALGFVARRFRVLGEKTRLMILQELFAGELTVTQICERTGLGQANASKHLSTLRQEGLVDRRKDGLFVHYRILDESVLELCEVVCVGLAERFEKARGAFNS